MRKIQCIITPPLSLSFGLYPLGFVNRNQLITSPVHLIKNLLIYMIMIINAVIGEAIMASIVVIGLTVYCLTFVDDIRRIMK